MARTDAAVVAWMGLPDPPLPEPTRRPRYDGSDVWAAMHHRHLAYAGDRDAEQRAIIETLRLLPCGECKVDAIAYVKRHPLPRRLNRTKLFRWGVRWHNHVRRKLRQATMTPRAARRRWCS